MNTDQSGIELEIHFTRTLSYKGEKTTACTVRSTNSSTHSYTVQPTITLDGHLLSPIYYELDINMSERNNIIRLTSLNHNQLSSETFRRMIKYAWYASGYTDTHLGPFKTVVEVCFSFDIATCAAPSCNAGSFICCSWCHKPLCFTHFFLNYHFH
jgi:hypothetical protein